MQLLQLRCTLYTLLTSLSLKVDTRTQKKKNPHVIKCTDYHSLTIKIIHILKYFQTSSVVEVYTGLQACVRTGRF